MSPNSQNDDRFASKAPIAMATMVDVEPMRVPPAVAKASPIDESNLHYLAMQGFTSSLARSLIEAKEAFALRIWVVDNSGSMQAADGHRIVNNGKADVKMVGCSRWAEIRECVEYHIQLAALIDAPTRFRFLNYPGAKVGEQRFAVADPSHENNMLEREALSLVRRVRPSGCTPLTAHIEDIHLEVSEMVPMLLQTGRRVAIVIATDGLPSDSRGYGGAHENQKFVDKLRLLEGLPVWVVIRLCTVRFNVVCALCLPCVQGQSFSLIALPFISQDSEKVVDFYNELDNQLELSIEVLDDFNGEAKEVYDANPWLNYSLVLHRMREMGYHDRLFDLIDNRLLTRSEIGDFCSLIFGQENFDGVPDPAADWKGFVKEMDRFGKTEQKQWNPITKRHQGWVNTKKLKRVHGSKGCKLWL